MLSESNFLILDEPTNHLDIMSKEILEDALNAYEGTLLYVSHDRYFINRTASRILDLAEGSLTCYLGNYDYYLEKRKSPENAASGKHANCLSGTDFVSETKQDWLHKKESQAKQRKRENDLKKCESEIASLEARQRELESEMANPQIATDAAKLHELSISQEAIASQLTFLYEQWETLAELL